MGPATVSSLSLPSAPPPRSGPVDVPVVTAPPDTPGPAKSVPPCSSPLSATATPFVPGSFRHDHPYERDRLDGYIEDLILQYESSSTWGAFIRSVRGRGDLHPEVSSIDHPAAHLLSRYQKVGTPAIIETDPWTPSRIQAALKRGPHSSCVKGIKFLREEYADMIEK